MANTEFSLRDINTNLVSQYPAIVRLPKVAVPYTSITNRAQVTDFSSDLLPRMGIDRFMTPALIEVQGEYGPNGERVFKPLNDVHEAVRFYGNWSNLNDSNGQRPQSATPGGSVEIVFYGTGINLLRYNDSGNRSFSWSVDGGASSGSVTGAASDVLVTQYRNMNTMTAVVSNLTLGLHTIVITATNNVLPIYGYEVINSSSSLQLVPGQALSGGRRLNKSALSTTSYNSGFESGTLGTRGGHVLVYQKEDGTVAKAVTPTDTSAAYLTSASHTNEEIVRVLHWREFGAGRSDDFSLLTTSASARAFTLDDGTTTLVVSSGVANVPLAGGPEGFYSNGANSYFTITFVGTGLDMVYAATGSNLDVHTFTVDGVNVGSKSGSDNTATKLLKICSGLPYGTHTVKVTNTQFVNNLIAAMQFIVYAPRTPTLPSGAIPLADYFVMADFSGASGDHTSAPSVGTLLKSPARELFYSGTWSIVSPSTNIPSGTYTSTGTANDFVQYTFWGTGVEIPFSYSATPSPVTVQLNGSAYTGAATVTNGGSWNSGTSTITFAGTGNIFRITGLSLGMHTIRVTKSVTADSMRVCGVYVITPIHAPKEIGPGRIQNVSLIGSCGVRDLRNFGEQQVLPQKAWCQAIGVSVGPSNTTANNVPIPDMSTTIKTTGGPIEIVARTNVFTSGAGGVSDIRMYVDGVEVGMLSRLDLGTTLQAQDQVMHCIAQVSAGTHKVDIYWAASGGGSTISAPSIRRVLTVREL